MNGLSQGGLDYFKAQLTLANLTAGLLGGVVIGIVVSRAGLRLGWQHYLALMVGWGLLGLVDAFSNSLGGASRVLSVSLNGALGGGITYAILRRAGASLDRRALLWIVLGWATGMVAGVWLIEGFYWITIIEWLYNQGLEDFAYTGGYWLFYSLGGAVIGFIGGLATFTGWRPGKADG